MLLTHRCLIKKKKLGEDFSVLLGTGILTLMMFVKFYPYYDTLLIPPATIFAAKLLSYNERNLLEVRGISIFPEILAYLSIMFSPLGIVFSMLYPLAWFFILTLIVNQELFPIESFVSFTLTALIVVFGMIATVKLNREKVG